MGPTSSTGIIPPLNFSNMISCDKYQEAVQKEPSISTMDPEETIITDEEYEEIVGRWAKIGKKISILMMNWSAELQETHNEQDKKQADMYYWSYLDKYIKRRRKYEYEIEKYEVFTRNKQFTEEEIGHLQRSLDGISRIPTPP